MILTVTLNPALDDTVDADRLVFEDRSYIRSRRESSGGRGLHASSVLHAWGAQTMALVPAGGETGKIFETDLARRGFPYEIVPIAGSIRRNLIITDKQGMTVKLNEPGPSMSSGELERFEEAVRRHLPRASWLLLCGSLPPGVPASSYRRLIQAARESGVRTLVDTDGEILQDALLEKPTTVTPNRQEAAGLLNKSLITRQHFRAAAQRMIEMGAESAIVTLGSRGAIAAVRDRVVEVVPPRVDVVCPIGSGDVMNAAFAWAMISNGGFADAVRWAVAAGTASARMPGMSYPTHEEARVIYDQVEIR